MTTYPVLLLIFLSPSPRTRRNPSYAVVPNPPYFGGVRDPLFAAIAVAVPSPTCHPEPARAWNQLGSPGLQW